MFSKIKNKNIRKVLAIWLSMGAVLVYNFFVENGGQDIMLKLGASYGSSQIIFNTFFNKD